MLVEVAHAIVKSKSDSKLKRFFLRIKLEGGSKTAIVALARKVLCILHHLLVHREEYREDSISKPKCIKTDYSPIPEMTLDNSGGWKISFSWLDSRFFMTILNKF